MSNEWTKTTTIDVTAYRVPGDNQVFASNSHLLGRFFVTAVSTLAWVYMRNKKRSRKPRFLTTEETKTPAHQFGFETTAEEVTAGMNLSGKTFLVTGSNSGIGLETVRVLALRGATVIAAARTLDSVKQATASFATGNSRIIHMECDLSKVESIQKFVKQAEAYKFDAIVANAGIAFVPKLVLIHGLESQFFVNHIGHFMVVMGLLHALKPDGRVVMVSSAAIDMAPPKGIEFDNLDGSKGYSPMKAYGMSKLANILFAQHMADRFKNTDRLAIAVHPGSILTNLGRHINPFIKFLMRLITPFLYESLKTVPQGAANQVFAAVHPAAKHACNTTHYLVDMQEHEVHPAASKELAESLFVFSEMFVSKFEPKH